MVPENQRVWSAVLLLPCIALLCATASASMDGFFYADECGTEVVQASQSDITKVAGQLLSPYVQIAGAHRGNVIRHSVWTAITLENWLTSPTPSKEWYFAAGLTELSMDDKKMIVFAGIVHDIGKGGFPSCSFPKGPDGRLERLKVSDENGETGTGSHPEAGAHMVAGKLPFLVYKEFYDARVFAALQQGGWLTPITRADEDQVMKWFKARWSDRHVCFDKWDEAFHGREVYKFDMTKYIEAAGLLSRKPEIQLLVGTHWGFGPVNRYGFVKMRKGIESSANGALFFLNTFERNIREAGLLERVKDNPRLKGKLGEWCALISYADVKGQTMANVLSEVEDSPTHLALFDLVTCDEDRHRRRNPNMYYRYGMETNSETELGTLPARHNYEILMAILGANNVVDYLSDSGNFGRENVEYFKFWSMKFKDFLGVTDADADADDSFFHSVSSYSALLEKIELDLIMFEQLNNK